MNTIHKYLIRITLIALTALPFTAATALEPFERAGPITSVGIDRFTVGGKTFRIAPGARLRSTDARRQQFRDFKPGDQIWFKGKVLDGANLVDMIVFETPDDN